MIDVDEGTMGRQLLEKWDEIRTLVESMDLDMRKNVMKSNASAGLRARRGLRLLKRYAHELLMLSVNEDKRRSDERKKEKHDAS